MTLKHFMRNALLLACIGAWVLPVAAYTLTITGIAKGLKTKEVQLSCSAWAEPRMTQLQADGRYEFVVSHPYPAMFVVSYGTNDARMTLDIFAFTDMKAQGNMINDNGNEQYFSDIPDERGVAFKRAKSYVDRLSVSKSSSKSMIVPIAEVVASTANMGKDEYTTVFANASKAYYIYQLQYEYGIYVDTTAFKTAAFQQLPIDDERFLGLECYKNLMLCYHRLRLKERLKASCLDKCTFLQTLQTTDTIDADMLPLLRMELVWETFDRFRYGNLSVQDRQLYFARLQALVDEYPFHAKTEATVEMLSSILGSGENQPAPDFRLPTPKNDTIGLHDIAPNKWILIDVWGSWCRPCRIHNPKLRDLYEVCQEKNLPIVFVSIAKETSYDAWVEALIEDRMPWLQLCADEAFVERYHVQSYPTTIAIDPQGIIRRVGPTISLSDILQLLMLEQK